MERQERLRQDQQIQNEPKNQDNRGQESGFWTKLNDYKKWIWGGAVAATGLVGYYLWKKSTAHNTKAVSKN
jgi:hypothetical protein